MGLSRCEDIAADAAEGFAGDAEIGAELYERDALEQDGVVFCDVFVSFGGGINLEEMVVFFLGDREFYHVPAEACGEGDIVVQRIDEGFVELSEKAGFTGLDEIV